MENNINVAFGKTGLGSHNTPDKFSYDALVSWWEGKRC
jgi:hypothetical protein